MSALKILLESNDILLGTPNQMPQVDRFLAGISDELMCKAVLQEPQMGISDLALTLYLERAHVTKTKNCSAKGGYLVQYALNELEPAARFRNIIMHTEQYGKGLA